MKSHINISILLIVLLSVFCACKKQNTKQRLLSNIENYQIDTIKAKPVDMANMSRADSCRYRADEVLRKYPEMYHATDDVTKTYNLWIEKEREFIQKVFVGKDSKSQAIFNKSREKLNSRLERLNFIEPMTAIIIDGADASAFSDTKITTIPDEDAITDCYRKIMLRIRSGIKGSKDEYSSDEMRSVCEVARRAWLNYIQSINKLMGTLPAESQAVMQQGIQNIICLHAIDLHNCYIQYWNAAVPGFVLKDDCTQEMFESSTFEALNMCKNMDKK